MTLARLAEELGVSRSTVSNAYNRPDQLSPELRSKVLTTARRLGYAGPDPAARALSRGRSGAVGLVFTEELSFAFSDPAAVTVLQGLASACQEANVGLLLLPVTAGRADDASVVKDAAVDGLAIYSMPDEDPLVEAAMERRLPTVLIDQPHLEGLPFVGVDDRHATRMEMEHLLELGHRRLGLIAYKLGPDPLDATVTASRLETSPYRLTQQRAAGYMDALEAAGLGWESVRIEERSAMTPAAGYDAAVALLEADPRPTAILTDGDQLAIGALQAARERGVSVPGQLSVVGLDDIPAAAAQVPPLTTVRQPLFEKGLTAGRLLLDPRRRGEACEELLPVQLVVRGSTGVAPAGSTSS
jgi:DNA-binding LacI/PurR family transcriptional regulator